MAEPETEADDDRTELERRMAYWGEGLHFVDVDPDDLRDAAALMAEQRRRITGLEARLAGAAEDTARIDLIERHGLELSRYPDGDREWYAAKRGVSVAGLSGYLPTARAAIDAAAKVLDAEIDGGESPPEREDAAHGR